MRSSVEPVARRTFWVCLGAGAEGGEMARQRMAELWALKRKVSAKEADCSVVVMGVVVFDFLDFFFFLSVDSASAGGSEVTSVVLIVTVIPWRMRS